MKIKIVFWYTQFYHSKHVHAGIVEKETNKTYQLKTGPDNLWNQQKSIKKEDVIFETNSWHQGTNIYEKAKGIVNKFNDIVNNAKKTREKDLAYLFEKHVIGG